MKGLETVPTSEVFTEVHRTSRVGLDGSRSSGSASLTLGWTPFLADPDANADFQAALQAENAQHQVDGLNLQQQALQAGLQPPPLLLCGAPEALERGNSQKM